VEITATYPAVSPARPSRTCWRRYGRAARATKLYPEAAAVADQEGFPEVAASSVYRRGGGPARGALPQTDQQPRKEPGVQAAQPVKWKCRNCGYIHEGPEAPEVCPTCAHPRPYYELFCEPY